MNPLCPKCKEPTVLKTGRRGPFYGCSLFPACNGSLGYNDTGYRPGPSMAAPGQNTDNGGLDIPFCPDDPPEAITALRDPLTNFLHAKTK